MTIEEFDTCTLIGDGWEGEGCFDEIPRDALTAGIGVSGQVGNAQAYLFDASHLKTFAVSWLEDRLG